MHLLILGATGATGSLLVDQALAGGHAVTAFVRDVTKMGIREGLTVVGGDVRDADSLTDVMSGADAVISALGLGKTREPGDLIADSTRAIVDSAERCDTKRVIVMSAFGVGDSLAKASVVARFLFKGGKATFADKAAGENTLIASDLDWTLVYPVLLTNKPASGRAQATDLADLTRLPGVPRISRADVADFLLHTAQDRIWSRRTVVLHPGR